MKYFWALVPINAPSNTEHFYTDTTKVGNLWLIWGLDNWGFFKPMLCAAGHISPFQFMLWQCTQKWHKPLQIFILSLFSARAAPWPDSSVTNTSFWCGKKQTGKLIGMEGEAAASFSRIVWILTVLNPMKISVIVSVHQINKTYNTEKGWRKIKLANSNFTVISSVQW